MNYKFKLTLLCLLINATSFYAQDRYKSEYPIKILFGTNVIDDSFTSNYVPFNFKENWNIVAYPSYFGGELLLNNYLSVGAALTINNYKAGKLVDGKYISREQSYRAVDVYTKFDLSNINYKLGITPHIVPYLIVGIGTTEINSVSRATYNYGIGSYLWFKLFTDDCNCGYSIFDNLGLFFQTQGKSSFNNAVYGKQIQHSLGIVYRFEK